MPLADHLSTLVDLGALVCAALLTYQLATHQRAGRPDARALGAAAEKGRALAAKLKKRTTPDGKPMKLTLNEHELEVASDVVAADDLNATFADIGGLQQIGSALEKHIILPLSRPELFKQSKLLRPPKGVLLHGPPGTGKTLLARALAREAKFAFICRESS